VFFSNGPGDPAVLDYAIANARAIVDSAVPTFGMCLGHQVLALVAGASVSPESMPGVANRPRAP
jgi:carbamoyl-phosphate synthase small subunit